MRARYPTWEALATAREGDLAEAIKPGGLSQTKAPRILAILDEIRRREAGSLELSWMRRAPRRKVEEYLISLPGVGPKTVACVLAFSLGRAAMRVGTHVYRVGGRLGFFGPRVDAAAAHAIMDDLVPASLRIRMHVALIRHGRTICKAGRPSCEVCPLQDLCPTAPVVLAQARPATSTKAAG